MMTWIEYDTERCGGVLYVKTEKFFPCSLEELKAIKKAMDMCKDPERKKIFVNDLQNGIQERWSELYQQRVELCAKYQCKEITAAKAEKDGAVIQSRLQRAEKNREVIKKWQEELQTSSN